MKLYERSHAALQDWQNIVEHTLNRHGVAQTEKYTAGLIRCIETMAQNQGHFKDIEIDGRAVRIKHCQKHYIFSLLRKNMPMIVIAIFHERMDFNVSLEKQADLIETHIDLLSTLPPTLLLSLTRFSQPLKDPV